MVRSLFVMVYYVTTGSWNSCGRSRGRGGSGGDGAAAKKQDKFLLPALLQISLDNDRT